MDSDRLTREELWSRQQISCFDVDYDLWEQERESLRKLSQLTQSCLFTVDVFKGRYDFASGQFETLLGYHSFLLDKIREQGDLLEDRVHPEDRDQLIDRQIEHSRFIYTLPFEQRNDYATYFQYRILNRKREYINVISCQRVLKKDRAGKAWIILGRMDISPDQDLTDKIKSSVLNLRTGNIINHSVIKRPEMRLSKREKEILSLISQGFLSKEIAYKLGLSIYTIHNHRKSILAKLNVGTAIEAINLARSLGLLS